MDPINRSPTLDPPSETPTTMNVSEKEETTVTFDVPGQAVNVASQAEKIQALICDQFKILHSNPPFPTPLHN